MYKVFPWVMSTLFDSPNIFPFSKTCTSFFELGLTQTHDQPFQMQKSGWAQTLVYDLT